VKGSDSLLLIRSDVRFHHCHDRESLEILHSSLHRLSCMLTVSIMISL